MTETEKLARTVNGILIGFVIIIGIFFFYGLFLAITVSLNNNYSQTTTPTPDYYSKESSIKGCVDSKTSYKECKCIADYIFSHYSEAQFESWGNNSNLIPQDVKNAGKTCMQNQPTSTPTTKQAPYTPTPTPDTFQKLLLGT